VWAAVLRPHRKTPLAALPNGNCWSSAHYPCRFDGFSPLQHEKRVLNYLSYVALAIPRALFVPCDVVIAMTDPPFQGIVGAMVAMLKRKPYVYNIRDLYADMAVGGSIVEPGILSKIWEKLHRWALRHAARVIVLGEDRRERIIAKRVEPARVMVVRD
jgi:colanic acid biosynthesis glycosyl transferase WcaI